MKTDIIQEVDLVVKQLMPKLLDSARMSGYADSLRESRITVEADLISICWKFVAISEEVNQNKSETATIINGIVDEACYWSIAALWSAHGGSRHVYEFCVQKLKNLVDHMVFRLFLH